MAYSEEVKKEVLELLQQKIPAKKIEELTGVSVPTINKWKKEAGLTKTRKSKEEKNAELQEELEPNQGVYPDKEGTKQEEQSDAEATEPNLEETFLVEKRRAELIERLERAKQNNDRVESIRNFRTAFRNRA